MIQNAIAHPEVVQRDEWLTARKALLEHEKELTKHRDRVNAERRWLPMVKLEKEYAFEGSNGSVKLIDLFEGRTQLIIYHFMFAPEWEKGCGGCTGFVNSLGDLSMLNERDTTFALVSRAPFPKLEAYKNLKGWTLPWYSSFGSNFNYDFHATLDETIAPIEYNYRDKTELEGLYGHSVEFVNHRMLTLVGWVEWRRRVGRCPNRCAGSHDAPFDAVLGIVPYQQTSIELVRLGCLLAVFLPFELAVHLLSQLCGIGISDDTVWQWVQQFGRHAMQKLKCELDNLHQGVEPTIEAIAPMLMELPLVIAADGVTVPFRAQAGTPKGKIRFQEVKIALLARLRSVPTCSDQSKTRLEQRRLVAVLGDMAALQGRLQLEALRQGITTAPQVVWISDGARGFWRLFEQHLASVAVGILDFYHAAQQLWEAAEAYGNALPNRTPQQWFERLRYQLRHGYVHRIIQELGRLLKYSSTPASAKPTLKRVRQYLSNHLAHLQYRQFKKQGFPIGSGMVESACKWLIEQRFKGTGMRWSETGFNHLLHLRLAWVNGRFDPLFVEHPLTLHLHSPNR